MTWQHAAVVASVIAGALGWYLLWARHQEAVARQKHEALRTEMADGAVKTFASTIEELKTAVAKQERRLQDIAANMRR